MPISTRDEMRRAITGGRYSPPAAPRQQSEPVLFGRFPGRQQPPAAPRFSPAPGAPGAGGAVYTSPYRGWRDREFNRIRFGGSGGATQGRALAAAPAPTPVSSSRYAPPAAPGGGTAATGTPSWMTRRAATAEALGNAGVQQPLPPPQDLKPAWSWADPANATIANAATPGKEGYVRSGEVGYSDRPDIVAWKNANRNAPRGPDGMNIVERFEAEQRRKGLLAGQIPDYSGSFGTTPQYSPEDAFNGKFDIPEFASVNSEDVKQWPQQAMAPEQITEAFQGSMDLDPSAMPNEPFRAPLRSSYQDTFSAEGLQGEQLVAVPVATQSVDRFPTQFNGATNTAAMAGFRGEADEPSIRFPVDAPTAAAAFNSGLDLGVSYADPDGNRDEAFYANKFLNRRKNDLIAAFRNN